MANKIVVGQKVYYKYTGYSLTNKDNQLVETTVTKVGRKFFEVDASNSRYNIETLKNDSGGYTPTSRIILSMEDYNNEAEYLALKSEISKYFSLYSPEKPTLEQLRRVAVALNINQTPD